MPKPRNKLKRQSLVNDLSTDVTISAFADSSVSGGCGRLRKNALQRVTKEVKLMNLDDNDRAWDEKLEDLIDDKTEPKIHRRNGKTASEFLSPDGFAEYPIDIWYLISKYLDIEDIWLFALICKATYSVVNSPQFWFCLYKRSYRPVEGMPEILQPKFMVRRYGLRALVIRSLYFTYPPFVARYQKRSEPDINELEGRFCVVAWTQQVKDKSQWIYNFKLQKPQHGRRKAEPKLDLLEMLDDINANRDDGCKLLQIKANHYRPIPMVIGQEFNHYSVKKHRDDYCSHHLYLQFSTGPNRYHPSPIWLQSVVSIRILDWWHPAFKHNDQLPSGLISAALPRDCNFE